MADSKISALTELTAPAADDEFVVVDKSDTTMAASGTDKRIKLQTVVPILVRKSADETVNNSNTPQNDNHLVLPVEANAVYQFELQLLLSAVSSTPDFTSAWAVPAGTTMLWGFHGRFSHTAANVVGQFDPVRTDSTTLATALYTESTTPAIGSMAGTFAVFFRGVIRVSSTAGDVQYKWSQNVADASDSKVLADSVLIARKIA